MMAELNFSLPVSLQRWIEEQIAKGHYTDVDDYLRHLIRRDRMRIEAIARVRALIEEGEASGIIAGDPRELIEEIIANRRARDDR